MTPEADSGRGQQRRIPFRAIGGFLWLLVFAALFVLWRTRSVDRLAVKQPAIASFGSLEHTHETDSSCENDLSVPKPLADFSLIERSGRTITKADLDGRPWVAAFVFTRCTTTCPTISLELKKIHDKLNDSLAMFVSITVDPVFDTPEILTRYADIFARNSTRWLFLTGTREEVYQLVTRGFGMYAKEMFGADRRPGFEVAHTNRVVLVNSDCIPVASFLATRETDMLALQRILSGEAAFPEPAGAAAIPYRTDAELNGDDETGQTLPPWLRALPSINAALNGVATILLCTGFVLIRRGRKMAHRNAMLWAFATSVTFLGFYLVYHFALKHYTGSSSREFAGSGAVRGVYLSILLTHVVLATLVPILALMTIYRAFRQQWDRHRGLARITFPVWLYVSVTGVIIYVMLYHWPVAVSPPLAVFNNTGC